MNGDTYPDLAVGDAEVVGESDSISVLLGNGDGTFQEAVQYIVGDGPSSLFLGDLDGDSHPDLAVANARSSQIHVMFNAYQDCRDADGDGHDDMACGGDDCNDFDPEIRPGVGESCDGIDNNCNGEVDEGFDDLDADGFPYCLDCDDNDPTRYPGAWEICDGIDNDCVPGLPLIESDGDADGYMICETDCDDSDPGVNPGADEVCNGIDDNCNGEVDEGFDQDDDGWTSCGGDCDDDNPDINPGATEICNGIDDNCDGNTDDVDEDGDGYIAEACAGNDCDDSNPDVNPGASEIPGNGIDDDCNPGTPPYGTPASVVGTEYERSSGVTNTLLLLLPIAGVVFLRVLRTKR